MLIVPLSNKTSWRNPPYITIVIILINCFVLFVLQSDDRRIYEEATEYYFDSGLAGIEVHRYAQYSSFPVDDPSQMSREDLYNQYMSMQQDSEFMEELEAGRIITPDDEDYAAWREKREQYKTIVSRSFALRYGFIPAQRSIVSFFTHMFLHGGFMHLLGNMIFLWLVGCVLELAWGRVLYIGLYIAGGLCAVMLFALVYSGSTTPLVGASGAIAGLMGAYGVLYGRRRIKVFYSLGFYFNYTRVPAYFILVLWIGNEFFQLFFGGMSNVAYVSHIGGLTSGALMAWINARFIGRVDEKALEEDPVTKIPALMEQALENIEHLNMEGAREILHRVEKIDPGNRSCLTHLYNIEKLNKDAAGFHEAAGKLLNNLLSDRQIHQETLSVYQEYISKAAGPRLPLSQLFRISSYFAATGHLEESEKILGMLLKKAPGVAKLPEGLLIIARACLKEGSQAKARSYLQVICLKYPSSGEYGVARRMLEDMPF